MPITNPEATNFVDTYMRPLVAERMRDIQAQGNEALAQWNGGISAHFIGSESEIVQDQNVADHPVTGGDVINTITRLTQVLDGTAGFESGGGLNGPNMMDAPLLLVVRTI